MADRPDHDLADRLDQRLAEWQGLAPHQTPAPTVDADDLCAAAARLRQLTDAIAAHQDCCLTDFWPELRAAAGDPEEARP